MRYLVVVALLAVVGCGDVHEDSNALAVSNGYGTCPDSGSSSFWGVPCGGVIADGGDWICGTADLTSSPSITDASKVNWKTRDYGCWILEADMVTKINCVSYCP